MAMEHSISGLKGQKSEASNLYIETLVTWKISSMAKLHLWHCDRRPALLTYPHRMCHHTSRATQKKSAERMVSVRNCLFQVKDLNGAKSKWFVSIHEGIKSPHFEHKCGFIKESKPHFRVQLPLHLPQSFTLGSPQKQLHYPAMGFHFSARCLDPNLTLIGVAKMIIVRDTMVKLPLNLKDSCRFVLSSLGKSQHFAS